MELRNRLAFHIPEKAWRKNRLEDIDIDAEMSDLLRGLENAGASSFYVQKVTGYYKGRQYPERILVIFCDSAHEAFTLADMFENWFLSHNSALSQEAFSYELNGTLVVKQVALPKRRNS